MIVGLKKRRKSKTFYDLGVLQTITVKTEVVTDYKLGKETIIRNFHRETALVKTFNEHQRGRAYTWSSNYAWTQPYLIEKICDHSKPASCKNEDCVHKFICFTNKVLPD